MVRRKKEKTAVLVLTAILLVLALFPCVRETLALAPGCRWYARLGYPFAHANFLHALLNGWCLLSLAFYYDVSWWQLLLAYGIAISFPSSFLGGVPVVGASGLCFALMGIVALSVRRKWYFQTWALSALSVGFLLPGCTAGLHLYCYLVGLLVGLLTTPLYIIKGN